MRPDSSLLRPCHERLDARLTHRRVSSRGLASADAENAGTLDQHQIGLGKPDAAGETDHQDARAPGDAAQALLEDLATDRIKHHVGAASIGNPLDRLTKRLATIKQAVIGPLR